MTDKELNREVTEIRSELLKADFPPEAYSKDTSRGFELTSIKAAYIIERLNDAFGLCGEGWRYKYGEFAQTERGEVLVSVGLRYRKEDGEWSEPIVSEGGKMPVNDNITDARKSAVTDGITKAASMLGIGHKAFKGLIKVGEKAGVVQHHNPMTGSNLATQAQVKLMFALGSKSGLDEETFKDMIREKFSIDSTTKLTKSQASQVINELQTKGVIA